MTNPGRPRFPPGYQPDPQFGCLLATGCAGLAILALVGLLFLAGAAVSRVLPGLAGP